MPDVSDSARRCWRQLALSLLGPDERHPFFDTCGDCFVESVAIALGLISS